MTKHENETHTLADIINMASDHGDEQWYDFMSIEIPGLASALDKGEDDDFAKASEIEAVYIREHEHDVYCVMWPEHVLTRRFDSDASYQIVDN